MHAPPGSVPRSSVHVSRQQISRLKAESKVPSQGHRNASEQLVADAPFTGPVRDAAVHRSGSSPEIGEGILLGLFGEATEPRPERKSPKRAQEDGHALLVNGEGRGGWGVGALGAHGPVNRVELDAKVTEGWPVTPSPEGRSRQRAEGLRSEERRVGKECRSRWSPYH